MLEPSYVWLDWSYIFVQVLWSYQTSYQICDGNILIRVDYINNFLS